MNVPRHTGTQRSIRETLLLAKLSHIVTFQVYKSITMYTSHNIWDIVHHDTLPSVYMCIQFICDYNLIYSALPCSVSVQDQQLKAATRLERKCQWQIQLLPIVGRHSRLQRALRFGCSDTTKRHKGIQR